MTSNAQSNPISRYTILPGCYRLRRSIERLIPHLVLIFFTVLALFPIVLIVINSFKIKKGHLWPALRSAQLPRPSA